MFCQTHCLLLFTTLLTSLSCGIFHTEFRRAHVYRRPTTYHPYFSNQRNYFNPVSTNLLKFEYDNITRSRRITPNIINVDHFGAKANGSDDSKAFKEAWEVACNSSRGAFLVVPRNKTYHLKPLEFSGPCNFPIIFKIYGTIKATVSHLDYEENGRRRWLLFNNVQNFRVEGGGIINGNGITWWQNSCKTNKTLPCKEAPTAVTFSQCSNLGVARLWIQNAQQMHLSFIKCVNVRAFNLSVTAPGHSPNTDGIHVTETHNIHIKNCVIRTGSKLIDSSGAIFEGDDCISIVSGSENVRATDITCGPGHGISIGSLGARNSTAYVSNVIVNRATLSGTTNGVRIKTWQGGSGYAKNIKFQNITMHNVSNPIIIDQYYCDHQKVPCPTQVSAVQVSNVVYENIRGTSASNVALKFNCSQSFPCQEIYLQNVAIKTHKEEHIAEASCSNIRLSYRGDVSPPC